MSDPERPAVQPIGALAGDVVDTDPSNAQRRPGKTSTAARVLTKPVALAAVGVVAAAGIGIGIASAMGGGADQTKVSSTTASSAVTTPVPAVTSPAPAVTPLGLQPIHAVFYQNLFSTVYTEPATDPHWTYTWAVTIPADPDCSKEFAPKTPTPNQATWKHNDVSEGGYCNHSGNVYNPTTTGHPGTVTLVVTDSRQPSEECTVSFEGTAPLNQDPSSPAVGSVESCSAT